MRAFNVMEEAMLCDELQEVLDIKGPKLVFEILAGAKRRLKEQYTKRIDLVCHFNAPVLNLENYLDMIKMHMIIINPRTRENSIDFLYAGNMRNFSSSRLEGFQEHMCHGPFAKNHSLGQTAKQDSEIVTYMILAFLRMNENSSFICSKCDKGYSSPKIDKLYDHCIEHGSKVPEIELNATRIKEEIKNWQK